MLLVSSKHSSIIGFKSVQESSILRLQNTDWTWSITPLWEPSDVQEEVERTGALQCFFSAWLLTEWLLKTKDGLEDLHYTLKWTRKSLCVLFLNEMLKGICTSLQPTISLDDSRLCKGPKVLLTPLPELHQQLWGFFHKFHLALNCKNIKTEKETLH